MNKITNIEEQKRNKERVNVYVDNDYAFSLSKEVLVKEKIKVNDIIDMEKMHRISKEDNFMKCKSAALRIIERTIKTEKEIREKLVSKEYDEEAINRSIDFLKEYNFLNDENYARMYVRDKSKGQGKNKIKYSLIRKGLDEETILEELSKIDEEEEENIAYEMALKKYNVIKKRESDDYKLSPKLYRFLISKGYGYDVASRVIKRITKGIEN